LDHLLFFAALRTKVGHERIALTTLAQLELSHHAHKMAGRLSGGMKRKLCCAVALVGDPHVVLLDEPSAGLDPVSQRNLWNLIKSTMTGWAPVWKSTSEIGLCVDLREPPCHRTDAVTATSSRRWPENSMPSSRRSYGDNIASMAWWPEI
jgi:alpha-D-ribose 1-methylphosphonate 5-triphosphate synthase subunit PhnL